MAKMKGKGKRQKLILNEKGGSSGEENKPDKPCRHVSKGVCPQKLKKVLPHAKDGECQDCRGKPKVPPEFKDIEDDEMLHSICICLKCAFQGCSRTSQNQHAHSHFQREASHTICANTTSWVIWCYACDKELTAEDENSELQKAIKCIRGSKKAAVNDTKENGESTACVAGVVKGLRNLGNTCFFNSVLQNISRATVLVEKLDSLFDGKEEVKIQNNKAPKIEIALKKTSAVGPLTSALKSFFDEFHSSSRGVVTPSRLFGEITKKSPQFRGYRQQDSQELLRYLLDGMRVEELKRIESAVKDAVKKIENPPTNDQLKDCFKNVKTFVDDVFGGMLVSTIICSECKSKSQVFESFFDLSLPVNTTPKETAKAAATRLFSGKPKNEEKTDSDGENQKNVSKHQKKVMAKKEKKAKRGKGKGGSSPKRKGSQASSGQQMSDDEHEDDSDDRSEHKEALTKEDEDLKQEENQGGDDSSCYSIKDEEDFVIIEKKIKEFDANESKSWKGTNEAMLGGQSSVLHDSNTSSLESLKGSPFYSRQSTSGGSDSIVSSKEDVSKGAEVDDKQRENLVVQDSQSNQEMKDNVGDSETRFDDDDKLARKKEQNDLIEDTICKILAKECKIADSDAEGNPNVDDGTESFISETAMATELGMDSNCKEAEVEGETHKEAGIHNREIRPDVGAGVSLNPNTEGATSGGSQVNGSGEEKENQANGGEVEDSQDRSTKGLGKSDVSAEEQESNCEDVGTFGPEYRCKSGECSVLSCLHYFTSKDALEGSNRFRCDECTKRQNEALEGDDDGKSGKPIFTVATKQMLVWHPPPVLTLHLKRFEQAGRGLRKVNKHIEFPAQLDLSPFCHVNKSVSKDDLQYNLFGIVEHSGSLHSGHYVACVKTRTVDNKLKWYYVSDSRVSEIQEEAVLRKQAYILFYHQTNRRNGKAATDN